MHRANIVSAGRPRVRLLLALHPVVKSTRKKEKRTLEVAAVTEDIRSYPSCSLLFLIHTNLFICSWIRSCSPHLLVFWTPSIVLIAPVYSPLPRPLLCLCNSIGLSLATKTHLIIAVCLATFY